MIPVSGVRARCLHKTGRMTKSEQSCSFFFPWRKTHLHTNRWDSPKHLAADMCQQAASLLANTRCCLHPFYFFSSFFFSSSTQRKMLQVVKRLSQRVTANCHGARARRTGIYNLKLDGESDEIKRRVNCVVVLSSRQMGSEIRSDLRSEPPLLFKLRWAAATSWCNSQTCSEEGAR